MLECIKQVTAVFSKVITVGAIVLAAIPQAEAVYVEEDADFIYEIVPYTDIWENRRHTKALMESTLTVLETYLVTLQETGVLTEELLLLLSMLFPVIPPDIVLTNLIAVATNMLVVHTKV